MGEASDSARIMAHAASQETGDDANRVVNGETEEETVGDKLHALANGVLEDTQSVMQELVKNIQEIERSSQDIYGNLFRARDAAVEKRTKLEEDRARIEEAAQHILRALGRLPQQASASSGACERPR